MLILKKVAIFLLSGKDDLGKAFHALGFAKQFKDSGANVKLIFDGAGTVWVSEFSKPDHIAHGLYEAVKNAGIIEGVCEFCIGHYGSKDDAKKEELKLLGEVEGHPNVAKILNDGYQIITL